MEAPIRIDVWSDIACPWCYIGKRKLEAGVDAFASSPDALDVEIEYHSFELSPDTPVDFDGNAADFLARHKGLPDDQVREMIDRVVGIAADAGLDYDYDAIQHTNTVKAHQLLHLAKASGRQQPMLERLMAAYFVEGRHVGRSTELAELAAEVGLDRDEVRSALDADTYLDAVRADQRQAQELGISGVPFFVLDGRYGISGAQPAEVFAQALSQVADERQREAVQ